MRNTLLLVLLAVIAVACACGSGEPRPADADLVSARAGSGPAPSDRYESRAGGFSVVIPPGWHRADGRLTPLVDPVERLVVATYPPRQGDEDCGPLAFGGFEADEALVVVLERGLDPQSDWPDFPARPPRFTYEPGMTSEFSECLSTTRDIPVKDHWFRFTDAGRHFHVLVVTGEDAPAQRAREAYAILDSLSFDPSVKPDWRSSG